MVQGSGYKFTVGAVLERGFAIFFQNIATFGVIAALVIIPYILLLLLISQGQVRINQNLTTLVLMLLNLLLTYLATAAIAFGTFASIRGQRAGISACLSHGLTMVFPVLGVAILSIIASLLGMVLLIVPGFIVLTMLYVAVPVIVVERTGVLQALSRSIALTGGYRWPVFGVIVVLILINIASGLVINLPFAGGGPKSMSMLAWNAGLVGLLTAFQTALSAVMATVVYHDLRLAKEGIEASDIGDVFD